MKVFDAQMTRFDKTAITLLVIFAVLAAIFGVGTLIHAYADIKPALSRANKEIVATLDLAERAVRVLERRPEQVDKLGAPFGSAVATSRELPIIIKRGAAISLDAADALDAVAQSLKALGGPAKLVISQADMNKAAAGLKRTATILRHLAPSLEALQKRTEALAGDLTEARAVIHQLQTELAAAHVTLAHLAERLQQTSQALDEAELPVEIARLVSLQGGIYFLLSVVLLGMAGLWKRMFELGHPAV